MIYGNTMFYDIVLCLQAYLVYKYSGKEQPSTTISRGSKYVAAPKSQQGTMMSTVTTSGNCSTLGKFPDYCHHIW